jgi:hypothetical protein
MSSRQHLPQGVMRRRSYVRVNLDKNLWWRRIAEKVNETESACWPTD